MEARIAFGQLPSGSMATGYQRYAEQEAPGRNARTWRASSPKRRSGVKPGVPPTAWERGGVSRDIGHPTLKK
jgi:hypothetical protein